MVIDGTGWQDVAVRLSNSGAEIFISVSKSRAPGQTVRISHSLSRNKACSWKASTQEPCKVIVLA